MGYEMPIVCKEVYLPYETADANYNYSIEEYKEKFGIDLRDIFTIVNNNVVPKNHVKLYIINLDPLSANAIFAQPVLQIGTSGQDAIFNSVTPQNTFAIQIDADATKLLRCGFFDNN